MKVHVALAAVFIVIGFLIQLHQFLIWGVWFQVEDLHHETFTLMSISVAIGIIIGTLLDRKRARVT